ncbi:uncharacterized protein LOC107981401 isoform X1 [Nasonia vitripennis]|uniref:SWIM-type domain-containing protein n=1 Tax=Nasonia vitripennis TaxID=7425 RepID=A0A7M7QC90_NASVI|nr:uncharacterized protein LOC107981401 isoform X1 [Nasonia vitripennis]XP_031785260.1 uncharacterized protein LOC107981401 isoform X1 [Nasonia vitripennis]
MTEIVSVCIVSTEDESVVRWFIECFKKHHSEACRNTKSFMGDKDKTLRKVIKEMFQVPMYICMFHSKQAFHNALSPKKMKLSNEDREFCLKIFQKMVYSKSFQEYEKHLTEFYAFAPTDIIGYFNMYWKNCYDEWVYFEMFACNYGNGTNNRLESVNQKLKLHLRKHIALLQFFISLFDYFKLSNYEKDCKAAATVMRRSRLSLQYLKLSDYQNTLTPYAFKYVVEQYNTVSFVEHQACTPINDNEYKSTSATRTKICTTVSCSCTEYRSMRLPCRHIFFIRMKNNLPLFSPDTYDERWSTLYYKTNQRLLKVAPSIQVNSTQSHFKNNVTNRNNDENSLNLTDSNNAKSFLHQENDNSVLNSTKSNEFNDDVCANAKENIKCSLEQELNDSVKSIEINSTNTEMETVAASSLREFNDCVLNITKDLVKKNITVQSNEKAAHNLDSIEIDAKMLSVKSKGRPKGRALNAIGLRRKSSDTVNSNYLQNASQKQ